MCRVNPKKVRQPEKFKYCWILNSSPDEIRPYRILVKKLFRSSMARASQNVIKCFEEPTQNYKDIMKKKDTSFYNTNKTFPNDNRKYVINLYSKNNYYNYINNYLRSGELDVNCSFSKKDIESWVWCLHKELTKKTNVKDLYFYRGVSRKFPNEKGIGSKFIFAEFTSVSEDLEIALGFARNATLFEIRIENNRNPPGFYCYDIKDYSEFPEEKEVLITSNCVYQVTDLGYKTIKEIREEAKSKTKRNNNTNDKKDDNDDDENIFIVYLTCLGNIMNYKNI